MISNVIAASLDPTRSFRGGVVALEFLEVVEARMTAHAAGIRDRAAAGDQAFGHLLRQGVPAAIDYALADLASFPR
jgi:hypothetical protein